METQLTKSVLKADKAAALKLCNDLSGHKAFSIFKSDVLITVKAPLKNENGDWIRNENNKVKRFLVFKWEKIDGMESIEYNKEMINIDK